MYMYKTEQQQKGWTWNPRDFPQNPGFVRKYICFAIKPTFSKKKKNQEHVPENPSTSNIFQKR